MDRSIMWRHIAMRRAAPYAARQAAYGQAMRRWKKSGIFGMFRGPKPQAPAAPPPELAPYAKAVSATLRKAAPLKAIARWARGTKFNASGLSEAFGRGVREIEANRFNRIAPTTEGALGMSREAVFGARGRRGVLYADRQIKRLPNHPYSKYVRQHEFGHAVDRAIKPSLAGRSGVRASIRRFTPAYAENSAAYPNEASRDAERIAEIFSVVGSRHHSIKRAGEQFLQGSPGVQPAVRALRLQALQRGLIRKGWPNYGRLARDAAETLTPDRLAKFFDESKVARDDDGKFAPKGGARSKMAAGAPRPRHVASIYSRGPQWEEREEKVRDPAGNVRPTKDMPHELRQAYARYRADLDASPPEAPKVAPRAALAAPADLPESGIYKEGGLVRTPQVPKALGEEKWKDIGRWAWKFTRDARKDVVEKAEAKRLIPPGTDERDIRAAYNHAANVALHDMGLFELKFAMTEEGKERLKPLVPFMVYARRRLQDMRIGDKEANEAHRGPGLWAPFRREFGKPFNPPKAYAKDTHGHKAGEEKRRFYRYEHHTLVKAWGGLVGRGLAWAGQKAAPAIAATRRVASGASAGARRLVGLAGRRYAPRGTGDALEQVTGRAWTPQMSEYRRRNGSFKVGTERVYGDAKGFPFASNTAAAQSRRLDRGLKTTAAEFDRTGGRGTRIGATYRGTIAARRAGAAALGAGVVAGTGYAYNRAAAAADRTNAQRRKSLYGTTTLAKATSDGQGLKVRRSRRAQARIERVARDPEFAAQWEAQQKAFRETVRLARAEERVGRWSPDSERMAWDRHRLQQLYTPVGAKKSPAATTAAADAELSMWDRDARAARNTLSDAERRQRIEAAAASARKRQKRAGRSTSAPSARWWGSARGRFAMGAAGALGVGLAGYAAGRAAERIANRRNERATA